MSDASENMPAISETEAGMEDDIDRTVQSSGADSQRSASRPPPAPGLGADAKPPVAALPDAATAASADAGGATVPGKTAGTSDEPPDKAPWAGSASPPTQVGGVGSVYWQRRTAATAFCTATSFHPVTKCEIRLSDENLQFAECRQAAPCRQAAAQEAQQGHCRWRRPGRLGPTAAPVACSRQVLASRPSLSEADWQCQGCPSLKLLPLVCH